MLKTKVQELMDRAEQIKTFLKEKADMERGGDSNAPSGSNTVKSK